MKIGFKTPLEEATSMFNSQKIVKLTIEEFSSMMKMQRALNYGRGIGSTSWAEMIRLRGLWLESKGENPSEWILGSRTLYKDDIVR